MKTRRVYVAGAYASKLVAREMMSRVRELGYTVTQDWTQHDYGMPDRELPLETAKKHADECYNGVIAADILWLLIPENASKGSWIELGVAFASPRCLVVASGDTRASIFLTLCDKVFGSHEEALAWLKETL